MQRLIAEAPQQQGGHDDGNAGGNGGGQVVSGPDLVIEGLPETEDESLGELVEDTIAGVLKSMPPKRRSDTEVLNSALFKAIRNEVNAYWGRKPNVSVFVHRV